MWWENFWSFLEFSSKIQNKEVATSERMYLNFTYQLIMLRNCDRSWVVVYLLSKKKREKWFIASTHLFTCSSIDISSHRASRHTRKKYKLQKVIITLLRLTFADKRIMKQGKESSEQVRKSCERDFDHLLLHNVCCLSFASRAHST